MCGTVLSQKFVKIRKPRRCWGCTKLFEVGSKLERVVGVDGGEITTGYWCDECINFQRKHSKEMDDCFSYGDILIYKKELSPQESEDGK